MRLANDPRVTTSERDNAHCKTKQPDGSTPHFLAGCLPGLGCPVPGCTAPVQPLDQCAMPLREILEDRDLTFLLCEALTLRHLHHLRVSAKGAAAAERASRQWQLIAFDKALRDFEPSGAVWRENPRTHELRRTSVLTGDSLVRLPDMCSFLREMRRPPLTASDPLVLRHGTVCDSAGYLYMTLSNNTVEKIRLSDLSLVATSQPSPPHALRASQRRVLEELLRERERAMVEVVSSLSK